MVEIVLWSLFVGSLGVEGLALGGWLRAREIQRMKRDREEEILTDYEASDPSTPQAQSASSNGTAADDLQDPRLVGWEYKIVRSRGDLFRDPDIFGQLCEEEAEAGWILFEKLDDARVRFKRPIAMRHIIQSDVLSFDPYRCYYGSSRNPMNWLAAIAVGVAIVLPAYLGYTLVLNAIETSPPNLPPAPSSPPPQPPFAP